jgi:hypothetical protein
VFAIELDLIYASCLFASILLSIPLSVIAGYAYGKLLNAVKGSEMVIATYAGFSVTALMCIVWLVIPFNNPKMGWFIGKGLRETIQLDTTGGAQILNNFLQLNIGGKVVIPIDINDENTVIPTNKEKVEVTVIGKVKTTEVKKEKTTVNIENVTIPAVKKGGIIPSFKIGDVTVPTVLYGEIVIVKLKSDMTIPISLGD